MQQGLTSDGRRGEAVTGNHNKFIAELIVTEVNKTASTTVQGVNCSGCLTAAVTGSWEVSGGQSKAKVQVVTPFLGGQVGVALETGKNSKPSTSLTAAIKTALERDRQRGLVGDKGCFSSLSGLGPARTATITKGLAMIRKAEGSGLAGSEGTDKGRSHGYTARAGGKVGLGRVWDGKTSLLKRELGEGPRG